jgi:hypothetical protein
MTIAVIGCGNMQTAPELCAALAQISGRHAIDIRLHDANEERLELVLRLLASMVAPGVDSRLTATNVLDEAIADVDKVVLTLHDDCIRRMVLHKTEVYDPLDTLPISDLPRGDFNRPTPVSELSPAVKELIALRQGSLDLDQAAELIYTRITEHIPAEACLSLNRSFALSPFEILAWPKGCDESDEWKVPHQILRWVAGDEIPTELISSVDGSALEEWLFS